MKNKAGRWVYVSAKVAPDTRLTIKQRLRKGSYFINWREGKTRRYEKAGKVLGEAVEQANRKLLQLQARVKGLDWHFGNAADPGRLTLREAIDAFLEELKLTHRPTSYELLIVDELGFVPLSKTGAELLFEMLSQRYERGSTLVTSNLPFQEWTEVPRLGTADRRPAGPAHPPRSHPGDERRQLPPQAEPPQTDAIRRTLNSPPQIPLSLPTSLAYFYSEALADFCFDIDKLYALALLPALKTFERFDGIGPRPSRTSNAEAKTGLSAKGTDAFTEH